MGQDPNAIRQEIEDTRNRMGETVDALGYKADVPARAKESISDTFQGVKDKFSGTGAQVADAAPSGDDVKQAGRRAVGVAQQNPLGLAIGAAALGFLAGMLIPSTDVEDQRLGPVADQVKLQARQTSHDAIEHGKQIAQDTADVAAEKAQEVAAQVKESAQDTAQSAAQAAQEAASEVKDTAQDSAQEHAEDLKSSAQDSVEEVQHSASGNGTPSAVNSGLVGRGDRGPPAQLARRLSAQ
jgi:gas vesicle protein